MQHNTIGDDSAFALLNLAVDLFSNPAIPYELSDQVYMRILEGVEQSHGHESRKKVEELFIRQASSALKALRLPNDLALVCPSCESSFTNLRGITRQKKEETEP